MHQIVIPGALEASSLPLCQGTRAIARLTRAKPAQLEQSLNCFEERV